MFRKNDLILLAVIFGSMGTGIGFPEWGRIFQPFPLYLMMGLLFFSFLKIEFGKVFQNVRGTASLLFVLSLLKLFIVPAALFYLTLAIWPKYAVAVLLLSGISTGVTAPFISGLLNASTLLVLMMVVVSSLLVPLTLPALVKLLVGQTLEISFWAMVKVLAMVIFVPVLGATSLRRIAPSVLEKLEKVQFPVSLFIFAGVNLGVFPKYSSFFLERPAEIIGAIIVAFILSAIYHLVGFLATWGLGREDRLAGAISFACMNSVIIIAFASEFFDPLSPMLAAMYMFPFFMMIVPARVAGNFFE